VTLTVTDARSGVGSSARPVVVNGPTPPIAQFTVLPASPRHDTVAVSTAAPARWAPARRSRDTTGSSLRQHAGVLGQPDDHQDVPGGCVDSNGFPVILTITDSLGRTAVKA
jgi:hypothetical protein